MFCVKVTSLLPSPKIPPAPPELEFIFTLEILCFIVLLVPDGCLSLIAPTIPPTPFFPVMEPST